jgi:hypothetical protein
MSVTAVATAQEATVIINGSDVDILIADLKLCLNVIRRTKPEMAIIGLTGRGKIDSAAITTLLGILHFVVKCQHGLPRTLSRTALSS